MYLIVSSRSRCVTAAAYLLRGLCMHVASAEAVSLLRADVVWTLNRIVSGNCRVSHNLLLFHVVQPLATITSGHVCSKQ